MALSAPPQFSSTSPGAQSVLLDGRNVGLSVAGTSSSMLLVSSDGEEATVNSDSMKEEAPDAQETQESSHDFYSGYPSLFSSFAGSTPKSYSTPSPFWGSTSSFITPRGGPFGFGGSAYDTNQ